PDPLRDHPPAGGGDLHPGRARADQGRTGGRGGGGGGGHGRRVHPARRARARRASLRSAGAPRPAHGRRWTLRPGAEPYLLDGGGARAVRGAGASERRGHGRERRINGARRAAQAAGMVQRAVLATTTITHPFKEEPMVERGKPVFELEETRDSAKIKVIGLGGGGSNAINRMMEARFTGGGVLRGDTESQGARLSPAARETRVR